MRSVAGPVNHAPVLQPVDRPHVVRVRAGAPVLEELLVKFRAGEVRIDLGMEGGKEGQQGRTETK
jgi:hypothetical protein